MNHDITLVIVSYNSFMAIDRCLATLVDSGQIPIVIIDNASTDGSAETLAHRFHNCDVVALKHNVGYGRAANIGLEQTKTPYAMLLNPDLHATPNMIDKLLAHALQTEEKTAILAPAVKEQDFTGAPPESVHWISGSAMLFNMEEMKSVGLFDENIFLFSEETDLCRRTINEGYKILLCHDVFMEHMKGQSSPPNPKVEYMKNWHFGWSKSYYFTKHNIASGKQNPVRMAQNYWLKGLLSSNKEKRLKYKARCAGVRAFISGEPAFCVDGNPKASQSLQS